MFIYVCIDKFWIKKQKRMTKKSTPKSKRQKHGKKDEKKRTDTYTQQIKITEQDPQTQPLYTNNCIKKWIPQNTTKHTQIGLNTQGSTNTQ